MFMNQDIKQSNKAGQASIQATLAGLGSGLVQHFYWSLI
jgi:hypothetical protein